MNIYMELNQGNALSDFICVADVTSNEQRERLCSEGYLLAYTKSSWECEYPDIPASKIFARKGAFTPSLMYIDMERYLVLDTFIYGDQRMSVGGMSLSETIQSCAKRNDEDLSNKKYLSILFRFTSEQSGYLSMGILSEMLKREKPSPELYNAFISIYGFVDYGASVLTPDDWKRLMACKSDAQKKATTDALEKDGLSDVITVYRGEGSCSSAFPVAYSWTLDYDTACIFAARRGDGRAKVLTGTVLRKDILEYITDRNEQEVIALPENVKLCKTEACPSLEDFAEISVQDASLRYLSTAHLFTYDNLKRLVLRFYKYKKAVENHGCEHVMRTSLLAKYLFAQTYTGDDNAANLRGPKWGERCSKDYYILMAAAILHDVARTDNAPGAKHGEDAAKMLSDKFPSVFSDYGHEEEIIFLVKHHCTEDKDAQKAAKGNSALEAVLPILYILKDADALDRWRFGIGGDGVNLSLMRNREAKLLSPVARMMCEGRIF